MSNLRQVKKRQYTKPKVVSKRVEFMTNTFGTGVTSGIVGYGPGRQAPTRQ